MNVYFNKIKITISYGETDWMKPIDEKAAIQIAKHFNNGSKVVIVPETGHMMHFENVIGVCNMIKNAILGTDFTIEKDVLRRFKTL